MGIEISGNSGRPLQEALDAGKTQSNSPTANNSGTARQTATSGSDQINLSNKAAQLQAMEAEISNLPVVDTQRVQDIQRTLSTGSFEIEPARVADKMLSFEAGLGKA
jgi:negative regulator of flagellin synthesis FlgM